MYFHECWKTKPTSALREAPATPAAMAKPPEESHDLTNTKGPGVAEEGLLALWHCTGQAAF